MKIKNGEKASRHFGLKEVRPQLEDNLQEKLMPSPRQPTPWLPDVGDGQG